MVFPDPMQRVEAPRTDLRTLRGQVVVLAFLDDACPGCDQTADLLQSLGPGGVTALGVATGISPARAYALATRRTGQTVRAVAMASDPKGALARAFGLTSLPSVLVLDRRGRVAERLDGPPSQEALAALLKPLLAEPSPGGLVPVRTRPHLSAFDRPAGLLRALPPFLTDARTPCPFVPGSLRLIARSTSGMRLFVARGIDGGIVTATASPRGAPTTGSLGCGAARFPEARRRQLQHIQASGVVSVSSGQTPGQPFTYTLVVLDGYTELRADGVTYPISDNGVIIEGLIRDRFVVISGPAGARRVRIGP